MTIPNGIDKSLYLPVSDIPRFPSEKPFPTVMGQNIFISIETVGWELPGQIRTTFPYLEELVDQRTCRIWWEGPDFPEKSEYGHIQTQMRLLDDGWWPVRIDDEYCYMMHIQTEIFRDMDGRPSSSRSYQLHRFGGQWSIEALAAGLSDLNQ